MFIKNIIKKIAQIYIDRMETRQNLFTERWLLEELMVYSGSVEGEIK